MNESDSEETALVLSNKMLEVLRNSDGSPTEGLRATVGLLKALCAYYGVDIEDALASTDVRVGRKDGTEPS